MKRISNSTLGLSILIALALGSSANAAFIVGKLDFVGSGVVLDTNSLATATKVNSFGTTLVSNATGTFAPFVTPFVTTATITTPWNFNSGSVSPFWQSAGFTFDLTSSALVSHSVNFLDVAGTGFVSGHGFQKSAGTWSFNITNSNGQDQLTFSFQSSSAATGVPDGGTTMALFGLSLLGLYGARRKFAKH